MDWGGCSDVQAIQRLAQWKAHKDSIIGVQWVQPLHEVLPSKGFITSASIDKGMALWSPHGAQIGDFGQPQLWDRFDETTWKSTVIHPASEAQTVKKQAAAAHCQTLQLADQLAATVKSLLREKSQDSDVSSVCMELR